MITRKNVLCVFLLVLTVLSASCTRGGEGGSGGGGNASGQKAPREILEMESSLLEIMRQADLVPVIERSAQQGGEAKKMTDLTFDETTLGEVLKREEETGSGGEWGQQKLPEESAAVWTRIKASIAGLHDQWDRLEPQVAAENIPEEAIASFEETLDWLTASATAGSYPGTLAAANQLTRHLAKFMEPFAEPPAPQAYEIKYYIRETVLQAAEGKYDAARENLSKIREQQPAVHKALKDRDAAERAEELDISLNNLQRAVEKEEPELVKINAAVVMENMVQAIEKMQGS